MRLTVDIDRHSGFCAGVINAIGKAEECLDREGKLFSLGAIVHNDAELERLERKGMVTIGRDDLEDISGDEAKTLLIRAHGEPPETYAAAGALGFNVIDCTCPVVLKLQKSILEAWKRMHGDGHDGQIIIFGKPGHAEVLGLVGQVNGDAVVVEDTAALDKAVSDGHIRLDCMTEVFSQTTKSPAEYTIVCDRLEELMAEAGDMSVEEFRERRLLTIHDTICSQVASRHKRLSDFAMKHDVIVFVSGKESSNGKVLCELCGSINPRTHHIDSPEDIRDEWFGEGESVGVCGATSTPKWLLQDVADRIMQINDRINQ